MQEDQTPLFTPGEQAPGDYFTGNVRIRPLVPGDAMFNCQVVNVVFEPGARTNWHTHPGGQILLATEGTGYYQEKDKALQVFGKGEVITIPPDVVHWHGASKNSALTHIAINTNSQSGPAHWLQRVTDEEYNSSHM